MLNGRGVEIVSYTGSSTKVVLEEIRKRKNGSVFGIKTLSDATGLDYALVAGSFKTLESRRYIEKIGRGKYHITGHEISQSEPKPKPEKSQKGRKVIIGSGKDALFIDLDKVSYIGTVVKIIDIDNAIIFRFDFVIDGVHINIDATTLLDLDKIRKKILTELVMLK